MMNSKKYKVGDIIKNPTYADIQEILCDFDFIWIQVGVLKIIRKKKK